MCHLAKLLESKLQNSRLLRAQSGQGNVIRVLRRKATSRTGNMVLDDLEMCSVGDRSRGCEEQWCLPPETVPLPLLILNTFLPLALLSGLSASSSHFSLIRTGHLAKPEGGAKTICPWRHCSEWLSTRLSILHRSLHLETQV